MKKLALTLLLVPFTLHCFAQREFGIKIYQNTDFFETVYDDYTLDISEQIRNVNFSRVSLAFDIRSKKGYTHEIELFIPEIRKSLNHVQFPMNYEFRKGDDFTGVVSTASVRYELNKSLTNEDKRFTFLLGAGINPYYVHIEYEPYNLFDFYTSQQLYGFSLNVIPRINYRLGQRLNMDLNIPLKVYDLLGETKRTNNPNIPIRDQRNTDWDHTLFETAYTIRLGLMYRLNG